MKLKLALGVGKEASEPAEGSLAARMAGLPAEPAAIRPPNRPAKPVAQHDFVGPALVGYPPTMESSQHRPLP